MIKRLTHCYDAQEKEYAALCDMCPKHGSCSDSADCVSVLTARLGAYEDTGLSPEEITALCSMEKRSKMANMLRWEEANDDGRLLILPCKVGDTVKAYLDDAPAVKKRTPADLSECVISHIEFSTDWLEPLFTATCKEKALYNTFWLSDFGKEIYTLNQYWALTATPKKQVVTT